MHRIVLGAVLVLVWVGCGDDDAMLRVDAGDRADGGTAPDGAIDASSPDAATIGESCAPPPDDLPDDIAIVEDGPFRRVESFPLVDFVPRTVTVYLPDGYDSSTERYPVVYFTDGQLVFAAGYRTHDAMEALIDSGAVEPHILVGIYSSPERLRELTPDEDPDAPFLEGQPSGDGDAFADQIVERVKGFVDSRFRTRCGRDHTTIAGFSLGGLMCAHMLVRDADVFGRGICMSPSIWWNDRSVLDRLAAHDGPMPVRLWIDVGTREAWSAGMLSGAPPGFDFDAHPNGIRAARDAVIAKGMTLGEDLGYYEAPGAVHSELAIRDRMSTVLAFTLSDVTLTDRVPSTVALHPWHDEIYAPPATVPVTETTTLSFETRYDDLFVLTWPNADVELSSRDEAVATVDAEGRVRAVAMGTATFDATFMGAAAEASIDVVVEP